MDTQRSDFTAPRLRLPVPGRRANGRLAVRRQSVGHRAVARMALGLLLLGVSLALAPSPAMAQEGIAPGMVPEAVVLETLDGDPVDLGQIIGTRPALVEFWASWCHVCLALHPRVMAAHERYGDEVEFLIVAVAVGQDQERVRQALRRHGTPGRVLWDARGDAVRAFEAPGTGFIVVLDAEGRVVYSGTGTDQDLETPLAEVVGRR